MIPKPKWLKRRLPSGPEYEKVRTLLDNAQLNTVCQQAHCPNQWECFGRNTATFLILGRVCTRNCRFCAVENNIPNKPDKGEPKRISKAVTELGLKYVVITSVTRDDLGDGGAFMFAETITELRNNNPGIMIEVLIPDFQGNRDALKTVIQARPDVINHNIETVARLYSVVRPQASYKQSLQVISSIKHIESGIITKSGIMLGLGETADEVEKTMKDLIKSGCELLTMGQYLQPGLNHLPVKEYVTPEEFDLWQKKAKILGFKKAVCGPFVRSSYKSADLISSMMKSK